MNELNLEGWGRMVQAQAQEGLSDNDDTEAIQRCKWAAGKARLFSLQQQSVQSMISEPDPVLGRGNLESGQWTKTR